MRGLEGKLDYSEGEKRKNTKWDTRERKQNIKKIMRKMWTKNKTKRHKDTKWGEAANECNMCGVTPLY